MPTPTAQPLAHMVAIAPPATPEHALSLLWDLLHDHVSMNQSGLSIQGSDMVALFKQMLPLLVSRSFFSYPHFAALITTLVIEGILSCYQGYWWCQGDWGGLLSLPLVRFPLGCTSAQPSFQQKWKTLYPPDLTCQLEGRPLDPSSHWYCGARAL